MSDREQLIQQLLKDLDARTTGAIRFLAGHTSRRSFLGKMGMFMAGMGAFPLLPVLREANAQGITPRSAGSETATVAWVGTCHNPADGRDYLISYNDCCGKTSCGSCGCSRSEGDKPVYFPSKSNSILWCFGSTSHAYHCTLALVIGHGDSNSMR